MSQITFEMSAMPDTIGVPAIELANCRFGAQRCQDAGGMGVLECQRFDAQLGFKALRTQVCCYDVMGSSKSANKPITPFEGSEIMDKGRE
jgi:hypothetical protein